MNERYAEQSLEKKKQAKDDEDYINEFRIVERQSEIKHTSGNVGKIGSTSKEFIEKLQAQKNKMPDAWAMDLRVK